MEVRIFPIRLVWCNGNTFALGVKDCGFKSCHPDSILRTLGTQALEGFCSPIDQFQVLAYDLGPVPDLVVTGPTTLTLYTLLPMLTMAMLVAVVRHQTLRPGMFQLVSQILYKQLLATFLKQAGAPYVQFFPLLATVFYFILASNLVGLIPFVFSATAQLVVTLGISSSLFFGFVTAGRISHGNRFYDLFIPPGVSPVMQFILALVELVSFFIRPFTLSIRLFANMVSGHILLVIFSGFFIDFLGISLLLSILPLGLALFIYSLELAVAFVQAYVFYTLCCMYLGECLTLGGH